MPYRASKNCSELLDMTQAGPKKLLKTAQNCSNLLKFVHLLKTAQNCSKCLKLSQKKIKMSHMGQQVSKGVMFLHIQVRKLS